MGRRRQATDPHRADRRAGRGVDIVRELLGAREPGPDLGRDALPQLGQDDPPPGALEEAPAAHLFELADQAADVRLACAVRRGDLAEAAAFDGFDEEFPLRVVHRVPANDMPTKA